MSDSNVVPLSQTGQGWPLLERVIRRELVEREISVAAIEPILNELSIYAHQLVSEGTWSFLIPSTLGLSEAQFASVKSAIAPQLDRINQDKARAFTAGIDIILELLIEKHT